MMMMTTDVPGIAGVTATSDAMADLVFTHMGR